MQTIQIGQSDLNSSRLVYGCMRIAGDGSKGDRNRGKDALRAALDHGYTLFDHADIYGDGACEEVFGELLRESQGLREQVVILGKCGVRLWGVDVNHYNLSRAHILASVEGSLQRLHVEQLDVLLLHRPDLLADLHEIAETFELLHESGKVAEFGVSNFSPATFTALQSLTDRRLQVNQVEINIHNIDALSNGTLDKCQAESITPQAWCPIAGIAYEAWGNTFTPEQAMRVQAEVSRQSEAYGVEGWQIALAWLLRHPAGISPLIGSTTPSRIAAAPRALDIDYAREDWYRLLEARNGAPVP